MLKAVFIRRCLDLGRLYQGYTRTNPLVGAVITIGGKIEGEGAHEQFGKAHAEVNAVRSLHDDLDLRTATIYVSLEPCSHFGKTPPCVNLILEKQIPNIVIGTTDPFHLVAGKSIAQLEAAERNVTVGVLEAESKRLIAPFVVGATQKRPYIILKYAQSEDGYLGRQSAPVWLTNAFSKHLVHKWRSEIDAIMVGTNTALIDDPQLTNRLYFGKKNPMRILIDRTLKVPMSHKIFDDSAETLVLTSKNTQNNNNVTYLQSKFEEDYLSAFMQQLYQQNIGTLMVEGGAALLQSFIDANLWDEARVFTAPQSLGEYADAIKAPQLKNAQKISTHKIANDSLVVYYYDKR